MSVSSDVKLFLYHLTEGEKRNMFRVTPKQLGVVRHILEHDYLEIIDVPRFSIHTIKTLEMYGIITFDPIYDIYELTEAAYEYFRNEVL